MAPVQRENSAMSDNGQDATPAANPWFDWALGPWRAALSSWPAAAFAPQSLMQPINPGWTFGNVIVNDQNSTAPDTEEEILRHHSYGRQIGRLMDAVTLLIEHAAPAVKKDPRATDLAEIQREVEQIKRAQEKRRVSRLRDELVAIKRADAKAWRALRDEVDRAAPE